MRDLDRIAGRINDEVISPLVAKKDAAITLLRWLHAEAAYERDRAEASRRDWAAEAMRLEVDAERGVVAELEEVARDLDERAGKRDETGPGDGTACDGHCANDDCHTVSAVATWLMAASKVRRRASLLASASRPVCAVREQKDVSDA